MQGKLQIESRGRIGNQMFIYSFVRRMTIERGIKGIIVIPDKDNRLTCFRLSKEIEFAPYFKPTIKHKIGIFLYALLTRGGKHINRISDIERSNQRLLSMFGLHMSQESCLEPLDGLNNIIALGYFQSEKCFSSAACEIKKDFEFTQEIISKCKSPADEMQQTESCCVHIRRGDYMKNKVFGVCTHKYYQRAIQSMKRQNPNVRFYVFSDDIDSVKKEFATILGNDTIYVPSEYTDQESLYLGSRCKHYIISNSTFSWWMQYLSDNHDKIVIAPSRWYNDERECHIYQPNWELIEP